MRIRTTAAIVAIVFAGLIALSVIGQEDPLPVVSPKPGAEIPLAEPTVVLAVEPARDFTSPTLMSAARANDYVTFDALYTDARKRGENVSPYATLHELWSWSMADPIGSFYGQDLYERLSRAYPGYATYIADFAITDNRGNVFYPTSETRAFLLDRVVEGTAPKVQIASRQVERRPPPAAERKVATAPKPEPVAEPVAVAPPVVITPEPAPVVAEPVVATPAPVVKQPVVQAPAAEAAAAPQKQAQGSGRGILLVIIGLIGIGLLALVLRTPREEPPVKIIQEEPPSNVEPMRKPAATPPADTRAAG